MEVYEHFLSFNNKVVSTRALIIPHSYDPSPPSDSCCSAFFFSQAELLLGLLTIKCHVDFLKKGVLHSGNAVFNVCNGCSAQGIEPAISFQHAVLTRLVKQPRYFCSFKLYTYLLLNFMSRLPVFSPQDEDKIMHCHLKSFLPDILEVFKPVCSQIYRGFF